MAPLIEDTDFLSTSSHDNPLGHKTVLFAPLHEGPITTARGVYFNETTLIFDVMGLDEYTPQELKASWYDIDDMSRMKNNARTEGRLLNSGLLVPGKDVTTRGLESRTRNGAIRKRNNRTNAYNAVFEEIEFQQHEEILDEEAIADAYFVHSEEAAINARMIAKRDAIAAKNIYMKSKRARSFWKKYLKNEF